MSKHASTAGAVTLALSFLVGCAAEASSSHSAELDSSVESGDVAPSEVAYCGVAGSPELSAANAATFVDAVLRTKIGDLERIEVEIERVRVCVAIHSAVVASLYEALARDWSSSDGVSETSRGIVTLRILADLQTTAAVPEALTRLSWKVPPQDDPLPSTGITQHDATIALMKDAVRVITCAGDKDAAKQIAATHPEGTVREAASRTPGCRLLDP